MWTVLEFSPYKIGHVGLRSFFQGFSLYLSLNCYSWYLSLLWVIKYWMWHHSSCFTIKHFINHNPITWSAWSSFTYMSDANIAPYHKIGHVCESPMPKVVNSYDSFLLFIQGASGIISLHWGTLHSITRFTYETCLHSGRNIDQHTISSS